MHATNPGLADRRAPESPGYTVGRHVHELDGTDALAGRFNRWHFHAKAALHRPSSRQSGAPLNRNWGTLPITSAPCSFRPASAAVLRDLLWIGFGQLFRRTATPVSLESRDRGLERRRPSAGVARVGCETATDWQNVADQSILGCVAAWLKPSFDSGPPSWWGLPGSLSHVRT